MGRFFTNLHIKNSNGRDGFINALKNAATGWEICGEDEAERMIRLGFSECYVTVACEFYNNDPGVVERDAMTFSAALNTEVFSVCGIDSDAAVMCVYSGGTFAGETAIGMADAYGMEAESPEPELWKPLLKSGAEFSVLSEIWQSDAVFVEELLCDSAELFGIKPEFITAEFDYFEDGEQLFLRKSSECPIKLAPKRVSKPSKRFVTDYEQTDDGTVMIFGEKYDIASTTSIEQVYSSITDEELIEAMPNIKRLTALRELNLFTNSISDISPLAELSELEALYIDGNTIYDISVLDRLSKLKRLRLDIWTNDLSPLERCNGLEELLLWYMEYVPEWLIGFKNLKCLDLICSREITDISLISALTGLTSLNLRCNDISDISPLAGLSELTDLCLVGNRISDVTPLFGLTKLKNLDLIENPISKADYELLKERLPNCIISLNFIV